MPILTALPAFAGQATYRGEQLLTWQVTVHNYHNSYVSWGAGTYHTHQAGNIRTGSQSWT